MTRIQDVECIKIKVVCPRCKTAGRPYKKLPSEFTSYRTPSGNINIKGICRLCEAERQRIKHATATTYGITATLNHNPLTSSPA